MSRRLLALGTAAALAATSLAFIAPQTADAKAVSTKYLLQGAGSGLLVLGGSLPAGSGKTAQVSSGCTDKVPTSTQNATTSTTLPGGLGSIGAMTSRTWTTQTAGATVNRYTQSKIASISVGNSVGSLHIQSLTITAHVWHNATGFHSQATATAGSVSSKLSGVPIPGGNKLPTPSTPITIPGLLTLSATGNRVTHGAHGAMAKVIGFKLTLQPTSTVLRIGAAWAQISDGVRKGFFGGFAYATRASVLGRTVISDGQPEIAMPCLGTDGKTQSRSLASAPLTNVQAPLTLSGATSSQVAKQSATWAGGHERAYISTVNLGNGALVIHALTAQANASRKGPRLSTLTTSTSGTNAGSITANGQSYTLRQLNGQSLDIPGLSGAVKVQTDVTTPVMSGGKKVGLTVVGLRLTLLDANAQTNTVIDLATARFKVTRA